MKKHFWTIEFAFLALIIEILFLFTILFTSNPVDYNAFVMAGIALFLTVLSYHIKLISSLIVSALFIFAYGSFLMLTLLRVPDLVLTFPDHYLWLILIPFMSATAGQISDSLNHIKKEAISLSHKVESLVTVDEITRFSNLRTFLDILKTEMFRSKRHEIRLSMMMIRIMYFEELISLYGKERTDEIVKLVSHKIENALRTEDSKYSVDQNTYCVIMPHTPVDGALIVKDRIKESMQKVQTDESLTKSERLHFEIRIGVLEYDQEIENPLEIKHMLETETEYDV